MKLHELKFADSRSRRELEIQLLKEFNFPLYLLSRGIRPVITGDFLALANRKNMVAKLSIYSSGVFNQPGFELKFAKAPFREVEDHECSREAYTQASKEFHQSRVIKDLKELAKEDRLKLIYGDWKVPLGDLFKGGVDRSALFDYASVKTSYSVNIAERIKTHETKWP